MLVALQAFQRYMARVAELNDMNRLNALIKTLSCTCRVCKYEVSGNWRPNLVTVRSGIEHSNLVVSLFVVKQRVGACTGSRLFRTCQDVRGCPLRFSMCLLHAPAIIARPHEATQQSTVAMCMPCRHLLVEAPPLGKRKAPEPDKIFILKGTPGELQILNQVLSKSLRL